MNFVAQTIADQLGGFPRLKTFVAAHNIVYSDQLVEFFEDTTQLYLSF